jgi:transcriptional regulator with XRE-family HTH domain
VDLGRRLADSLQRARREKGLTQAAMARRLGISQPTLNRIENASQNEPLMVPLPMVVRHELIEGAKQATLPEEDELSSAEELHPPRPPRTVREPLDSYGSYQPADGLTPRSCQCANNVG